ncbi:hypothetical protein [Ornithinibacillus californiensis]|jgi:hypothetical protein|uniref:hypothetical protein n=1 Tax=Ornithinibacillus californiensis TaxID=161536 RepID=UPI00064DAC80|nr:hypothetical protein [Ornithinibacillus californiensis]
MIGNSYLQSLFSYPDKDTSLNQMLELLKTKDREFIESLKTPIDVKRCSEEELTFLTIVSAVIDYYFQVNEIDVPSWLRMKELTFQKPYFYSRRINDFEKVKLMYTNPSPFRARNVYFDLNSLGRV